MQVWNHTLELVINVSEKTASVIKKKAESSTQYYFSVRDAKNKTY
jgi:hypothetical protein